MKWVLLLQRITNIGNYLRGDFIVLRGKGDRLIIDAGNNSGNTLRSAARVFYRAAYDQG